MTRRRKSLLSRPRWFGFSALILASALACSSEVQPRGQLMIAISSDMSITKDMDEVRVEVIRVDGTPVADRQIPILPAQEAPFGKPLPGTLSIVPADAGGEALRVRLTARHQDPKTGVRISRVVREAIVKVPTDRTALLRMPLRWLCDGEVEAVKGDGERFRSKCPSDDETCVAGECRPADVDANSLPDFSPEEVFGGGQESGQGSYCLNVQRCFAHALPLKPDADCTVPLPNDADARSLNVALVLPPMTDGHCVGGDLDGTCYMPLDNDATEGFAIDRNRIRLPGAACSRKQVLGVAVSVGCRTKDLSVPVCGPWTGWADNESSDGSGGTGGTSDRAGKGGSVAAETGGAATAGESFGAGPGTGGMSTATAGTTSSSGGSGASANRGGASSAEGGALGQAGEGNACTTQGCYSCDAQTASQLLNHCTTAACQPFNDAAAGVPVTLPPLP